MMSKTYIFKDKILAGRTSMAMECGLEIHELVKSLPENGILYLDFQNVDVLDYPFADEAYLQISCEFVDGRHLVIVNAKPNVLETLCVIVDKERDVLIIKDNMENLHIYGSVLKNYKNTLKEIIEEKNWVTAKEISMKMKTNNTKINNHVKSLYHWGVISRDEGTRKRGTIEFKFRDLFIGKDKNLIWEMDKLMVLRT